MLTWESHPCSLSHTLHFDRHLDSLQSSAMFSKAALLSAHKTGLAWPPPSAETARWLKPAAILCEISRLSVPSLAAISDNASHLTLTESRFPPVLHHFLTEAMSKIHLQPFFFFFFTLDRFWWPLQDRKEVMTEGEGEWCVYLFILFVVGISAWAGPRTCQGKPIGPNKPHHRASKRQTSSLTLWWHLQPAYTVVKSALFLQTALLPSSGPACSCICSMNFLSPV